MDRRHTDERKNNVALAHSYHERKRCSKFGEILPSGLGGDSVTDRWTDARRTNGIIMLFSPILTMRESDVASLVEFRPLV